MPAQKKHKPLLVIPKKKLSIGQRAADGLTNFCGSWTFILSLFGYIAIWIFLNLVAWSHHWDPWPFIMLNLTLSCLAAVQAPIILMSNKRQGERDSHRLEYDYGVDRKTLKAVSELLKKVDRIERKLSKK